MNSTVALYLARIWSLVVLMRNNNATVNSKLEDIKTLLASGGSGGGSSSMISVATSTNYTITNEDFVRATGSSNVTITLPTVSSTSKRITIKNYSSGIVTINPVSGLVNGMSNIQLAATQSGDFGNSVTLNPEGGQFWVV